GHGRTGRVRGARLAGDRVLAAELLLRRHGLGPGVLRGPRRSRVAGAGHHLHRPGGGPRQARAREREPEEGGLMTATVLTALGHDWEGRMVEIVDRLPGVGVGRRCADLADLLAAASAGHGDVALVSADLRGLDRDALTHLRRHGIEVVGASRDGDEVEERQLRQLGIGWHVHLATPREDLLEVLTTGGRAPAGPPVVVDPVEVPPGEDPSAPVEPVTDDLGSAEPGTVVAVWGPVGAPGRSTLAVNLASEIAASGTPALLLDLDTYGASVAQLLSVLDEAPGLAAAARAS